MRIGMIGLGRMGGSIARRLMRAGHETIVWDRDAAAVASLVTDGAAAATSLADLVGQLGSDAIFWVMLPAGDPTETTIEELGRLPGPATIIIDGGNSFYKDDIRRAKSLAALGIDYVDVGTSGGVWGVERGFCLMIGGARRSCAGSTRSSMRSRRASATSRAPLGAIARTIVPNAAISTPARRGADISSRWSTTASNMA